MLPVLIVSKTYPTPQLDSGSQRLVHLLRLLHGLGLAVRFLAYAPGESRAAAPVLDALGVERLAAGADYGPVLRTAAAQPGFVWLYKAEAAEVWQAAMPDGSLPVTRKAVVIFDTVDLHHLRTFRMARTLSNVPALREALRLRELEVSATRQADITLVVSNHEQATLRQLCPGAHVHVVSNVHITAKEVPPFAGRRGLLFIGSFSHFPNVDGLDDFLTRTWPLVTAALPGMTLDVIGAHPPEVLLAHAGPQVRFAGFVEDVRPHFQRVRASLAPLRFGAGVKGKVLQSMSLGTPVVGTSTAAEGLGVVDGVHMLTADAPAEMTNHIVRLEKTPALWETLSRGGLALVQKSFSETAALEALRRILNL